MTGLLVQVALNSTCNALVASCPQLLFAMFNAFNSIASRTRNCLFKRCCPFCNTHVGKCKSIDLMFIFCFVLSEWTVPRKYENKMHHLIKQPFITSVCKVIYKAASIFLVIVFPKKCSNVNLNTL